MAQLFVGQLPFNKFYPDDLIGLFRPYGTVIAHELYIRTGSGFVTFASTEEADLAITALHGKKVVEGRVQPLQVMYSKGSKLISAFGRQHRAVCCAKEGGSKGTKMTSVNVTSNVANGSPNLPPPPQHTPLQPGDVYPLHAAQQQQQQGIFLTPPGMMPQSFMPLCFPTGSAQPRLTHPAAMVTPSQQPMAYSIVYVMGAPPLLASSDSSAAQVEGYYAHPMIA